MFSCAGKLQLVGSGVLCWKHKGHTSDGGSLGSAEGHAADKHGGDDTVEAALLKGVPQLTLIAGVDQLQQLLKGLHCLQDLLQGAQQTAAPPVLCQG